MASESKQWDKVKKGIVRYSAEFDQMPEQKFKDKFAEFNMHLRAEVSFEVNKMTKKGKMPVSEDALDEVVQGVLQQSMANVKQILPGLSEKRWNWFLDILAEIPDRYELKNRENTITFCDKLATKIVADCRTEYDRCLQRLKSVQEGKVEDDDNFNIYHSFSNACRKYLSRYIDEKRGVQECQYKAYDRVRHEVNRKLEALRQASFTPEFLRRRREVARMGGIVCRRCANKNCRVPWSKTADTCKHVFCGVAYHDVPEDQREAKKAAIPMRGKYQKTHGCGQYFDFTLAPEVTKKEWDEFWSIEENIAPPKKEEIKSNFRRASHTTTTRVAKKAMWRKKLADVSSYILEGAVQGMKRLAISGWKGISSLV